MPNSIKSLERRIRKLIHLEQCENEINKIKIAVKKLRKEIKIIKIIEIKNLEKIKMEISMLEGKMKIKRIWNSLDEFEMKELEGEIKEEIKLLGKNKNKARIIIKGIEKSISKIKKDGSNEKTKYISKYISRRNKINQCQI